MHAEYCMRPLSSIGRWRFSYFLATLTFSGKKSKTEKKTPTMTRASFHFQYQIFHIVWYHLFSHPFFCLPGWKKSNSHDECMAEFGMWNNKKQHSVGGWEQTPKKKSEPTNAISMGVVSLSKNCYYHCVSVLLVSTKHEIAILINFVIMILRVSYPTIFLVSARFFHSIFVQVVFSVGHFQLQQ